MEFGIELFFEWMSVWVCSSTAKNQCFPLGIVKAISIVDVVASLMRWGLFQRYQWEVNILMSPQPGFERIVVDDYVEKDVKSVVCCNNARCWYYLLGGHVVISLVDTLMK